MFKTDIPYKKKTYSYYNSFRNWTKNCFIFKFGFFKYCSNRNPALKCIFACRRAYFDSIKNEADTKVEMNNDLKHFLFIQIVLLLFNLVISARFPLVKTLLKPCEAVLSVF